MTRLAGWNGQKPDRPSKPTSRRREAAPPHSADDLCLVGKSISPRGPFKGLNSHFTSARKKTRPINRKSDGELERSALLGFSLQSWTPSPDDELLSMSSCSDI